MRAATLMTLLMAPLSIGLGAVGPTIVAAFFPPAWAALGPMLFALAAVLVTRPIGTVFAAYLQIKRGPAMCVIVETVSLALLLLLIFSVGRLGPLWVCAMVGVAFALRALMFLWFVERTDGLRVTTCLGRMAPLFAACSPMVAAVIGVRHGLWALGVHRPLVSLGLEVIAGALGYTVAAWFFAPAAARDFLGLLLQVLRRRRLST
jgi:lipopolysaccharide exporter